MGWFSKDEYVVHYKSADGEEKCEKFPTYQAAMARKIALNKQRMYAYIKKE